MRNSDTLLRFRRVFPVALALPLVFSVGAGALMLTGCGGDAPKEVEGPPSNPLLQPRNFTETAPDTFVARLETTKGVIRIQVVREWSPLGADRFYNLVKAGYYDGVTFHRVIDGFMAEFGIHGDPWVNAAWRQATMQDEPVRKPNSRGRVSYSKSEPEHPDGPDSSSIPTRTGIWTVRGSRPSARWWKGWRWWTPSTQGTGRARPGEGKGCTPPWPLPGGTST